LRQHRSLRICLLLLFASFIRPALADGFPSRTITIVVGFSAGGIADTSARLLARSLQEQLRQPVIVENRAGASGVIASRWVQRATPDGYTILYNSTGPMISAMYLMKSPPYDTVKDFAPIRGLTETPMVLVTKVDKPYKTLSELIAYAKAHPGKVSYGSVGPGSTLHIASVMLEQSAGIEMLHVPYKGAAPAMNDLLGGQIDVLFDYLNTSTPQINAGAIRALGLSSSRRVPDRDVPTIAEQGQPSVVLSPWYGIFAPLGTPPDVVEKLSSAFGEALKTPAVIDYNLSAGSISLDLPPEQFKKFLEDETAKWKVLAEKAGVVGIQ
jgi:tripartite-type tricarboxylate transporter receptor subunit TctC